MSVGNSVGGAGIFVGVWGNEVAFPTGEREERPLEFRVA